VMGDFVGGWDWVTALVAVVALLGLVVLARTRSESAILAGCIAGVPLLAFVAARSGAGAALETRHLIFVLPFFMTALVVGLERLTAPAGRFAAPALGGAIALLLAAQVTWGLDRTPWLYEGEPDARTQARADAAAWLAATSRPDDVLFGYEPTYLDAWEKGAPFGDIFVPRADPKLALEALEDAGTPLGRGVWVLDASDHLDPSQVRLSIPDRSPGPAFEARAFGPFLVVRTRSPARTVENYLQETLSVQGLSSELGIGDAGRNRVTAEEALDRGVGVERALRRRADDPLDLVEHRHDRPASAVEATGDARTSCSDRPAHSTQAAVRAASVRTPARRCRAATVVI